ncbi:hypothetical protein M408DRAFT_22002 [Serendipita vermifera MAFF 305830]|uniref:Peptidase S8/S53 domain-containing protein n=1 Tax=Serendipita vermifera MAFF 305830 TaxID=933852 RepID=A0A0C2XNE0_SERVB|nr:hypothetical protein M408DRAFT_22002 [Serendipita vermifera MAFF 305830]
MKYALTFLAATAFSAAAATIDLSHIPRGTSKNVVPNAYVVEIDPNTVGISSITGKRSMNPHADLYAAMHKRDISWSTTQEYEGDLYTGASVRLSSEDDLVKLANINGVVAIHPIMLHQRPKLPYMHTVTGADDALIPTDTQSTHKMCGVDKLHGEGVFGSGVKIGIIDSGFDYLHPQLGGGFGPGYKFASGYDFVGDAYTGLNTPVPDEDPMDCGGHGTHVAGIIGADPGGPYNISGVAYKAELAGYRVFGCDGSVADDILIAAITRAYNENAQIITLSIGGPAGWTSSPSAVVASRAAKAGRIVTIAAGNEGDAGMWYASGPASGIDVIAVGSADNTVTPIQYAKVSGHADIPYYSLTPLNFTTPLPVWPVSKTIVANDACDPLPADTPDLSGYVVLIRRGTCTFVSKLANVAAKGARVALIYNNGGSPNSFVPEPIPGALISTEDGAYLLSQFLAGTPPTISFPQDGGSGTIENPTGGLMSTFSTYGPSFDAYMKPQVSAPGGGILSTIPRAMGSYAIYSGTSMATPYVAGTSALLLQTKGASKEVARAARDLLQTTAHAIRSSKNETALLQTASVQGAGLIDAYNMVHYKTVVSPGQLLLNDTANFKGHHTIQIFNSGTKKITYTLTHKPAGTAQSLGTGSIQNVYPVPLTADAATVSMPRTVTVNPGQKKKFDVDIRRPSVDAKAIPVYSGYIEIASQDGAEILAVTYLGIASKLKDATILDNTDEIFGEKIPAELNAAGNITRNEETYTFVDTDYPSILFRLVMGTRKLVFDLVSENTTVPNTISRRDVETPARRGLVDDLVDWFFGWLNGSSGHHGGGGSYNQIPTVGGLLTWEYNPRHTLSADPDVGYSTFALSNNTFANNTRIPNGRYKILLRALKITGDLKKEEDYEAWLSPVMVFNATSA